jgi:hypothetical protein
MVRNHNTHDTLFVNDGGVDVEANGIGIGQTFHGAGNVDALE